MNTESGVNSSLQFFQDASAVAEKLKSIGWIEGYSADRQDVTYQWTEIGKSQFATFLTTAKKMNIFSPNEIEFLRVHLFYFGIKRKSKSESLFDTVKNLFDQNDNEPVWVTIGSSTKEYDRMELFDLVSALAAPSDDVLVFRSMDAMQLGKWTIRMPKQMG